LEVSGVDTVVELSNRIAENLLQKMSEINERDGLVIKLPALSQVENWIISAKLLPREIEY
jgi:chlorosome envelope protein I